MLSMFRATDISFTDESRTLKLSTKQFKERLLSRDGNIRTVNTTQFLSPPKKQKLSDTEIQSPATAENKIERYNCVLSYSMGCLLSSHFFAL